MKKRLLIALAVMLSFHQAKSQFIKWENTGGNFTYDLSGTRGNFTASLSGDNTTGFSRLSTIALPGWLPAPSSGTAYLRAAAGTEVAPQNGKYDLDLNSQPKKISIRIPSGGPTKLTVYGIANATEIARFSTTINFGTLATIKNLALLRLAIGNTTGEEESTFTSTGNITNNATSPGVFAAVGFEYNSTSRKVNLKVRRTGSNIGTYINVKTDYFDLETDYQFEIIGNNSEILQKYNYGSNVGVELPARSYHIYVDGNRIDNAGNENFNFPESAQTGGPELAVNKLINSFGMWGLSGDKDETKNPTYTISNMRLDYAETTLPVSLTSLTAEKQYNAIKLNWVTASELKSSHFDVLRSSDGKQFHSLTQIAGAGTSTEMHRYSYIDYNPVTGTNYYKLRQVDLDGTATDSDIQAISINLEKDEFMVYQEGNNLVASIYSNASNVGTIKVTDVLGNVLLEKRVNLQSGYTRISLGKFLKPGVYIANIVVGRQSKAVKFFFGE